MTYASLFQQNLCGLKYHPDIKKEAVRFQHLHNSAHPDDRIWRYMLYERVFHFLRGGILLTIKVEMIRFIHVDSGRTFTFYSSLFLPRTSYVREFVRTAISSPASEARFFVSAGTLRRWESTFTPLFPAQDHKWTPRPALPGMV